MIDLRSDTVTKPSKEMLEEMIIAPVGDDVFGEDPTVNKLQDFSANIFGKEAALFCSSGTQTNQIAINLHAQPGAEVITHFESHVFKYEGGGIARNSGASTRTVGGSRGRITASEIEPWINPSNDVHYPLTQLVSIEDTSNRGGGAIYDFKEIKKIRAYCNSKGLPLHLDGARVFNALEENKVDIKEYAKQFDSISVCLSKGLGAPIGSLLIADADFIARARRVRKVFGGGMRQAGFIAAAGLYALKNNIVRLKDDHRRAKIIESELLKTAWVESVMPVESNIVVCILKDISRVQEFVSAFEQKGVLIMPFGKGMLRMVTHLDFSEDDTSRLCMTIRDLK